MTVSLLRIDGFPRLQGAGLPDTSDEHLQSFHRPGL